MYVTVYTTVCHAFSTNEPRSVCLSFALALALCTFWYGVGTALRQKTMSSHALVNHLGLRTCDWTKRFKPLLTTSTSTTSPKVRKLVMRQSKTPLVFTCPMAHAQRGTAYEKDRRLRTTTNGHFRLENHCSLSLARRRPFAPPIRTPTNSAQLNEGNVSALQRRCGLCSLSL